MRDGPGAHHALGAATALGAASWCHALGYGAGGQRVSIYRPNVYIIHTNVCMSILSPQFLAISGLTRVIQTTQTNENGFSLEVN